MGAQDVVSVVGGVGSQEMEPVRLWLYTAFWRSFTTKWGQKSTYCLKKQNSEPNPTGVKVPRKDLQRLSAVGLWASGTWDAHWGWASMAGMALAEIPRPVCRWCTGCVSWPCQGLQCWVFDEKRQELDFLELWWVSLVNTEHKGFKDFPGILSQTTVSHRPEPRLCAGSCKVC